VVDAPAPVRRPRSVLAVARLWLSGTWTRGDKLRAVAGLATAADWRA
jgi:hypothetical protein